MEINLSLLSIQNPWWSIDWQGNKRKHNGINFDPTILEYAQSDIKWSPNILNQINLDKDIAYFINGSPGVGKSTILKLLIKNLINSNPNNADNILYYSCHNLYTFEQLNEAIKVFSSWRMSKSPKRLYIFLDEIESVKHWVKGLEYLQKAKKLKNISLIVSGTSVQNEKMPNFIKNIKINPLSFEEFYNLLNISKKTEINEKNYLNNKNNINYCLDIYFLTGGYISALNNFKKNHAISQSVYDNLLSWLMNDIGRLGRDSILLKQIFTELIEKFDEPIGYKTIANRTKAKTHLTIADYLEILESMSVTRALYQSDNKGKFSTQKAKKIYFSDPFLYWLVYSFIYGSLNFWEFSREHLHNSKSYNNLAKNIILNHLDKISDEKQSISYWRDNIKKQEIDFVYRSGKSVWPIAICHVDDIIKKEKTFAAANFNQGIIITNKLDITGKYFSMPLSYFLLFYKNFFQKK